VPAVDVVVRLDWITNVDHTKSRSNPYDYVLIAYLKIDVVHLSCVFHLSCVIHLSCALHLSGVTETVL